VLKNNFERITTDKYQKMKHFDIQQHFQQISEDTKKRPRKCKKCQICKL